jgi:FkbH-like protein
MSRDHIDELIRQGGAAEAVTALSRLFSSAPTAGNAAFVVARYERLAPKLSLTTLRIAILRSFTVEPLVAPLRARCYLAGLDASIYLGDYNLFEQELLQPASGLYEFQPDIVVLAALTRDLAPALWDGSSASAAAAAASQRVTGWVEALRRQTQASLIIQSFEQPAFPVHGVWDARSGESQRGAITQVNTALAALAQSHRGVYVLDYDALVARHGRTQWSDPHKDLAMRVPMRPESYGALADEYMRFVHPISGRVCKAIAIDLDNTLWGGVLGEEGSAGITMGADYPGPAFRAVQRQLKSLAERGILLTICSKNNPDEALATLRDHPDMLLRPDDFAAMRINWEDKARNITELAAELNIGVDAFAFLDDNPVERAWVAGRLPEVTVINPGSDPVHFADAIRRAPVFERLSLSAEDRMRTEQYRAQRERAEAASSGSVEDFLRSLEMVATVDDLAPATLGRVAQLTQKTNQFNVTTRRYSEEQVSQFAASSGALVRTIRVSDRYGDNGLVGVLMARINGARCEIDTMLLSCRVIGRGVETLMLADAAEFARRHGATTLAGEFAPTAKNAPAADVFERHGFMRRSSDSQRSIWEIDLSRHQLPAPGFIKTAIPS